MVASIIASIIIGLGLLELYFGLFLRVFGIYPSFRELLKDGILIEDKTSSFFRVWHNWKERYRSLILTKKYLILRNTYFTSLRNIEIEAVNFYTLRKAVLSRKSANIILHLKLDGENIAFKISDHQ